MRWMPVALMAGALAVAQAALGVYAQQPGKPPVTQTDGGKGKPTFKKVDPRPRVIGTNPSGKAVTPGGVARGTPVVTPGQTVTKNRPPLVQGNKGGTAWAFRKHSAAQRPPRMTTRDRKLIQDLPGNPAVTAPEGRALGKVLAGEALSPQERSTLSALARTEREGVTGDDREAVSRALDDDLERSKVSLSRRYLYLRNDTGAPLTVFVVYQTLDPGKKKWLWLPGKPPTERAVEVSLPPGAVRQAKHGTDPILACRARLWATTGDSSGWNEWKDNDLLLVPEKDEKGYHRYYAHAHDTFTFRFQKK